MREDAGGDGGHQRGLRGGQRLFHVHALTRHGAGEAVGLIEHFQHRRDDQCTHHTADDQRHLLSPRCGLDQPAGFQILQVVVRYGGHRHDGRTHEQRQRQHELPVALMGKEARRFAIDQQHQRDDHHRDDAHAGDRAGRRTDQAGHVAAGGRHQKADEEGQQRAQQHQDPAGRVGNGGRVHEVVKAQPQHHQHAEGPADHGLRAQILLDAAALVVLRGAHGGKRQTHALGYGFEQHDQGPDGGHTECAGADEAYLLLPECEGEGGHVHIGRLGQGGREVRHQHAPGNDDAHQDGDAAGQTHHVACAQQGQRVTHGDLEDGVAGLEPVAGAVGHHPQAACAEAEDARNQPAGGDVGNAAAGLVLVTVFGTAGLEDLGGGHALGIGQRAVDHHGVAQRYGEDHAQNAARHAEQGGLPERKAAPVAGHQQAGQDEDDRGQGAGRRGLGLHHVVLEDVAAPGKAQQRHRDDGSRDG